MLGGYQIIDLRNIGLELKGTQQTISDAGILKQLRGLRDYIEKGHDYKQALNNSLKPILIRYRDAKNNEKKEVTSFASVINENASLTFTIVSKHLEIEIVFEEKTDSDSNKYYDIKTAKYLYSLDEVIEGDLAVGGDVSVTDDVTVGGDLVVTGKINNETNPSVKPIYFHPITVIIGNTDLGLSGRAMFVILDNNPTPYTKTTFIAKCKEIMDLGAVLQCNGFIKDTINNEVLYLYLAIKNGNNYELEGNNASGTSLDEPFEDSIYELFSDGVNKIN